MEIQSVFLDEPGYPALLARIARAPRTLYVKGNADILCLPSVAIVGTRKATPQGLEWTQRIAKELAGAGLVIVSGLAQGIDGAAHQGALEAQGKTVAALASSLEEKLLFPKHHLALARAIMNAGGALVSEHEKNIPARKGQFVARNRIVSGLSLGVLVVESPLKGGSLITAEFAHAQKRVVCAVPGSPWMHNAKGTNALIKKGAFLVEHAADILEILAKKKLFAPKGQQHLPLALGIKVQGADEKRIVELLSHSSYDIDKLAQHTKVEIATLLGVLMEMEVKGIIKEAGGKYMLIHH